MRALRPLLLAALLIACAAPLAQAQATPAGPTVIIRISDGWALWFVWDDNAMAVVSSDPNFFIPQICDGEPWPGGPGEGWVVLRGQIVLPAQMKQNSRWTGPMFTRVYTPIAVPEEVSDPYFCGLLRGEIAPLFAQGISEFKSGGINDCFMGPGQNTWFIAAGGHLVAPSCTPTGIAAYRFDVRWMIDNKAILLPDCVLADPNDIKMIVFQMNATCMGQPMP